MGREGERRGKEEGEGAVEEGRKARHEGSAFLKPGRKVRRRQNGGRERGGEEGGGEAARTNVGDVQVATVANTLGRLRIMMPYCIQIRIPTVVAPCVGIWA